jgi:hypothetical protein
MALNIEATASAEVILTQRTYFNKVNAAGSSGATISIHQLKFKSQNFER